MMRVSPPPTPMWSRRFLVLDAGLSPARIRSTADVHDVDFVLIVEHRDAMDTRYFALRPMELLGVGPLPLDAARQAVPVVMGHEAGDAAPAADARCVLLASDGATILAVGPLAPHERGTGGGGRVWRGAAAGETMRRRPVIVPSGPARAEATLYVNVDLLGERALGVADGTIEIDGLPPDWEWVDVDVLLASPSLTFPSGRAGGTVRVHRSGESEPCALRAIVGAIPADARTITLHAHFAYAGRFCGAVSCEIPVDDASAPPRSRVVQRVDVDARAEAPRLTAYVRRVGEPGAGRLLWQVEVSGERDGLGLPASLSGESVIGGDPATYARTMYAALAAADRGRAAGRDLDPADDEPAFGDAETPAQRTRHLDLLRGFGAKLFRDKAPQCFKAAYSSLRQRSDEPFPIQFITDEPHLPWAVMCPAIDGRAADPLAFVHPVARWVLGYEGAMRSRLPVGTIATLAPDYGTRPGLAALPAAQREAAAICRAFGDAAVRVPGTIDAVSALFRGTSAERRLRDVGILHFAGHGRFDEDNADLSYIALEDDDLRVVEIDATEVTLGSRCGSFVVFDACEVGHAGAALGSIGGWASTFLARQFSGFVAPLWAVRDEGAAEAMTEFLANLVTRRMPLGAALQDVRRRHGARSPTFYSYVCYGDVMARLAVRDDATATADDGPILDA